MRDEKVARYKREKFIKGRLTQLEAQSRGLRSGEEGEDGDFPPGMDVS